MATCSNTTPRPTGGAIDDDRLRWLVETDRRRGAFGVHAVTDISRANRIGSTLWLDPAQAEAMARAILAAVEAWRLDQAVTVWTQTMGGRCHG